MNFINVSRRGYYVLFSKKFTLVKSIKLAKNALGLCLGLGLNATDEGMFNSLLSGDSSTGNGVQKSNAEVVGCVGKFVSVGKCNSTSKFVLWAGGLLHNRWWGY